MTVAKDKVVSVIYTLTDDQGALLDTNKGQEALDFIQGHGMMIPGFEKALEGATEGQTLSFTVSPAEGYGESNDDFIIEVPRTAFPEDEEVQVGWQVTGTTPDGQMQAFRVLAVSDETIKLDANHPLAGKNLNFEVEVVGLRDATEQELAHGHVHADGHDH
ncbi:peptidyl-prolyl cis-trans isomerase [Ignatzschineria indica]|uniref:Peptidyl-prolyl cis-trans isomerase n=1 Tax=Ignatzschineria indica TaxID=472583 RepID=A0A2U2AIN3_9GAMM|nr:MULTISPECIES: peptidylprolyl isomerase [Ignatzschineria]MDM1545995.1 peptidylprolyl isomerase [Ignatzschineria indica]OYQ80728.1 peptidylprolyl isomerase [Ignatzschineria sp. F8392]PWD82496.1 peptidylprolyl isomerase [Ignatzschineria indica]GGZ84497.1 peptidyl-prolyl cis-trans isomerase [Ignatzschineria indica]